MEDITRAALETLADLKRRGVIATHRPCCGQSYCVCEHAPHTPSLRDHASNPTAYDRAIGATATLRVLTRQDLPSPTVPPCSTDSYLCTCPSCATERKAAMKRGSRDVRQPWDIGRAA